MKSAVCSLAVCKRVNSEQSSVRTAVNVYSQPASAAGTDGRRDALSRLTVVGRCPKRLFDEFLKIEDTQHLFLNETRQVIFISVAINYRPFKSVCFSSVAKQVSDKGVYNNDRPRIFNQNISG